MGPNDDIAAWREEQIGTPPYFYNCYAVADGEVAVGAVAANGSRLLAVAGLDPDGLEAPARLAGMTVSIPVQLKAWPGWVHAFARSMIKSAGRLPKPTRR